ncbi:MAG TPA: DUF3826 domain-containing protein [Candidatus Sulfotelmatobacter sp.]|jgi:hypothetical protein|nr:DUF3826 domain-containing protein [Candidatus Sulfotelmatobacter sp.]
MKKSVFTLIVALSAAGALAQTSTTAPTDAEKEAFYAKTIEYRVGDILKVLNLTDDTKSNTVHDLLVAQYHALRVRDAAIDTQLKVDGKDVSYENRAALLAAQSKPLHDKFFTALADNLSPDQIEKIKDLMTYNKVKVTYDAYCQIIPDLTDAEKAKIMDLLKSAREEAVDGGSAPEKSAIFQKYKDQINTYLDANGHDTAKALKAWADAHPNTNNPAAK